MLKKNFTRKNLSDKVNRTLGFSKNISSIIVDDFFDAITYQLINKKKVKISSFGTFEVVKKKERLGRNPKTKENVQISARKIIKFRPSLFIKRKLNN